jgi:ribonuclease P protein subunit RPR2
MDSKQGSLRQIIYERIDILLSAAASALRKGDEKYAKRYVFLARKLSTRYNCRMGRADRARFCKSCGMPSVPGLNTKVRLRKREKTAEYLCSCGAKRGFKYRINHNWRHRGWKDVLVSNHLWQISE